MRRRRTAVLTLTVLMIMTAGLTAGCGSAGSASSATSEETDPAGEETDAAVEETDGGAGEADIALTEQETSAGTASGYDGTLIRVGSLTGPTTMGLVNLMDASDSGTAAGNYEFTIGGSDVSEITALVAKGDLDIAMIPANVAATLYNNDAVDVTAIDINTLGVLYCITGDASVTSVQDLAGRMVQTTGQGSTPEYVLRYLLDACGVEDCVVEFYDQTQIVANLQEKSSLIAILPQPFATSAMVQNAALLQAFSLTDAWDEVSEDGSMLITGATVVRTEYLEEHPEAVAVFLEEHASSAQAAAGDIEGTAELVVSYGILDNADIAAKALPFCNIVCITGEEMKAALTGYLQVLYNADPASVGGALPENDFYYTGA